MKLLGHLLRASPEDPMKQAALKHTYEPIYPKQRRVGKPRKHWINETMKDAYNKYAHEQTNQLTQATENYIKTEKCKMLYEIAQDRKTWKDLIVYQKDEPVRKYDK